MDPKNPILLLTLPQVIDAALGRPQLGIVCYGLLNNILQVICQQLNLEELQLQYQGVIAEQLQKFWDPEMKTETPNVFNAAEKKRPVYGGDAKMVVVPDSASDKYPTMTLTITQSQIDNMVNDIKNLKGEVADLRALPSNNDLFMAVKAKPGQPTPLIDMYQILTITKRVDATEQAIMKVASFVEDLAKFIQGEEESFREIHEPYDSQKDESQYTQRGIDQGGSVGGYPFTTESDQAASHQVASDQVAGGHAASDRPASDRPASDRPASDRPASDRAASDQAGKVPASKFTGGRQLPASLDLSFSSKLFPTPESEKQGGQKIGEEVLTDDWSHTPPIVEEPMVEEKTMQSQLFALPKSKMDGVEVCEMPNREAFKLIQEELRNLKRVTDELFQNIWRPSGEGGSKHSQGQHKILMELDKKIGRCVGQINGMDNSFSVSYNGITNRLADIEESMKLVYDKAINEVHKVDFEEQLSQSVYTLNERVKGLEIGVTKISDTVEQVLEDAETDQNKIMNLLEDLENLKADKIGRHEFSEALAEKVDLCMVNRKVSHDQFNATCDDLSKGIEEALEKLMEQEELWHVALKEIQEEISGKLCKDDLQPLETFVSEKLKTLQHKMKTLAKLKKDQEAAATKRKFLSDVQCISCDKDVVMRKTLDVSVHLPPAQALSSHKNMAPYLAYELDHLRKQQNQMQFGKNLHHFEAAMQDSKGNMNRYCGGQHTITTPQQRVIRPGNFIDQWGAKAAPADDNSNIRKTSNTNVQIKLSKMPLTVRSAIKTVEPEKDENKEMKSPTNGGRRSP